jgi:hypothetical protein
MSSIQSYLEKLGGNFLVAAFIPSLAFVTISIVSFGPIIPQRILQRTQYLLDPLGELGLVILLIAIIIGFTLTTLNTQVYKLFEGYVLFKNLSFFRNLELKRAHALRADRKKIIKKIKRLKRRKESWSLAGLPEQSGREKARLDQRIKRLEARRDVISVQYDQRYPPYDDLILPTRMGNILRSAETYPLTRWGMDSVPLWPRLIYAASIAPKGDAFLSKVDFSNDQCSFLLNTSLLSSIYAGLALMAALYQGLLLYLRNGGAQELLYFIPIDLQPHIYLQRTVLYIFISCLGLGLAWYFYTASLWNVSQYGNLIRSTFDLFRFNLLESLHLPLPENNSDNNQFGEKFIWRKINELMNIGEENGSVYLAYSHSKHLPDPVSELIAGIVNTATKANEPSSNGAIDSTQ